MSLPSLAIRRPVATTMFFLAVLLIGVVSLTHMPVALLPDVSFPRLVVWTTAANIGPGEIERFVTEPIEEAMATVPGVREIESTSREEASVVTLTFPWGTDMEFAQLHVREQLEGLAGILPTVATRPTILRVDPDEEPILIASATSVPGSGASVAELATLASTVFSRRLEQLDGVARATVVGAPEREIVVEVDPARLASFGLSIAGVATVLDQANASAPGGTIRWGRTRHALRALGEFRATEEIASVVVARAAEGGTIRVADIASVRDTLAEGAGAAFTDGRPSVGILVYKENGANTVAAAEAAEATFWQLEAQHPELRLTVVTSQARFVTGAIRGVIGALVAGALLAFLVLFPFLRDARWPAVIALSIPISVIGTFALLHLSGVSFNIMSLGGLALGVGMLVDNSIVVLENVFRHRERGLGAVEASAVGAEEVQIAITSVSLTTIAVFGPIVYVEGLAGALFGELALAVSFSLLMSLLVALTLLPVVAARFGGHTRGAWEAADRGRLRGRSRPAGWRLTAKAAPWLDRFDEGFEALRDRHERALAWALDHRGPVLRWTAAGFAAAVLVAWLLPRDVLPDVDQRAFRVRITLPVGTPLEDTGALALRVDGWLRRQPEVEAVMTRIGRASVAEVPRDESSGRHTAVLDIRVDPSGAPTREVMARLREAFGSLPPGALVLETGAATEIGTLLGSAEADVAVEVRGGDLDSLRLAAEEIARRLIGVPVLFGVGTTFEAGQPEMRVSLDREAIAGYGLEVERVVGEFTDRTEGRTATQFTDFDRKIPIVVRAEDTVRRDLEDVLSGTIDGVPLRELVEIEERTGPAAIRRKGQQRTVAVTANVAEGGLAGAVAAVRSAIEDVRAPAGVRIQVGGGSEELRRSFRGLAFALLLAFVLVYMILAAEFESLVQPFIVMLAVPLAALGAVMALAMSGNGLSTMSLIGIIILVGIAVDNAILELDFIHQARAAGEGVRAAILAAGRARLRPILMTSATTVLGLLPLAAGLGSGAELQAPLAIAVIGGMVSSTLLVLIVVPVFYSVVAEPTSLRSAIAREIVGFSAEGDRG